MRGLGNRSSGGGGRGIGRGGGAGAGPGGSCVCPQCGTKVPHQPGIPCFQVKCPQCGTNTVSYTHLDVYKRQQYLHKGGVNAIVAGGMGPRAQNLFQEVGIDVYLGAEGPIDAVIEQLQKGTLIAGESSCTHEHGSGNGDCDHHHG